MFVLFQNIQQLFALVCETQKYSSVLQQIIESTRLLKETKLRLNLAKVANAGAMFASFFNELRISPGNSSDFSELTHNLLRYKESPSERFDAKCFILRETY